MAHLTMIPETGESALKSILNGSFFYAGISSLYAEYWQGEELVLSNYQKTALVTALKQLIDQKVITDNPHFGGDFL